jgi:uncharacterized protein YeaO (DUF488 family)
MRIAVKRAYAPASARDGQRFLVDRVWPRGRSKAQVRATWLRDAAPSTGLRRWFGHDPARWAEFQRRYARELRASGAWQPVAEAARRGQVTLVFGAKDEERNNAVALARFVERRLR